MHRTNHLRGAAVAVALSTSANIVLQSRDEVTASDLKIRIYGEHPTDYYVPESKPKEPWRRGRPVR